MSLQFMDSEEFPKWMLLGGYEELQRQGPRLRSDGAREGAREFVANLSNTRQADWRHCAVRFSCGRAISD
jgi:hypothetical protein